MKKTAAYEDYVKSQLAEETGRFELRYRRTAEAADQLSYFLVDTATGQEYELGPEAKGLAERVREKAESILEQEYHFGKIPQRMQARRRGMKVLVTGSDIKAAAPKPVQTPPAGHQWAYDPATDSWYMIKSVASMLDRTNLLAEFRHLIYPKPPREIRHGSTVFVKSAQKAGTVIREMENTFRVELAGGDEIVNTYWPQELEPLAD